MFLRALFLKAAQCNLHYRWYVNISLWITGYNIKRPGTIL